MSSKQNEKKNWKKDIKNDDESLRAKRGRKINLSNFSWPLIHSEVLPFGTFTSNSTSPWKRQLWKLATNYMYIRVLEVLQSQLLMSFWAFTPVKKVLGNVWRWTFHQIWKSFCMQRVIGRNVFLIFKWNMPKYLLE